MPNGYSLTQIRLHWIIAVLIALQFLFHDAISAAFGQMMRGEVAEVGPLVWGHVAGGIAILALAVWRLRIRAARGVPPLPPGTPALLERAATIGHWVLYGLMILTPLSGMSAWFGGLALAGSAHEVFKSLLLIVVAGHVAAALWHQFGRRDHLLLRMMRADR